MKCPKIVRMDWGGWPSPVAVYLEKDTPTEMSASESTWVQRVAAWMYPAAYPAGVSTFPAAGVLLLPLALSEAMEGGQA